MGGSGGGGQASKQNVRGAIFISSRPSQNNSTMASKRGSTAGAGAGADAKRNKAADGGT
jgi:hypothetical protein